MLAGRQSFCVALESKSKWGMCLEVGRVLAVLLPPEMRFSHEMLKIRKWSEWIKKTGKERGMIITLRRTLQGVA
jgi:hypothetical protein